MALTPDEIERYSRQLLLPEWGAAGQERVRDACVVVFGDGPAAETALRYLAAAGVRRCDRAPGDRPIAIALGERARIFSNADREATGAACAVEALKAILQLPFQSQIDLPSLDKGE